MGTPYEDIIKAFLGKVTDLDLPRFENDMREEIVMGYMKTACAKFSRICSKVTDIDLSDRDNILKCFNDELDDEVIDIITENMLVEWLKPKVLFSDNLSNVLNTKDFSTYSPANMLKELRETLDYLKKNARALINNYSFAHSEDKKHDK